MRNNRRVKKNYFESYHHYHFNGTLLKYDYKCDDEEEKKKETKMEEEEKIIISQ